MPIKSIATTEGSHKTKLTVLIAVDTGGKNTQE